MVGSLYPLLRCRALAKQLQGGERTTTVVPPENNQLQQKTQLHGAETEAMLSLRVWSQSAGLVAGRGAPRDAHRHVRPFPRANRR
jgi:hypothetical protein